MKKILVPTDFSACATHAADLAVELAADGQTEVHFYTRVQVNPLWDQLPAKNAKDFPESFAQISRAQKQFQCLRKRYRDSPAHLVTAYSHGDLVEVVTRYIDEENISLIVMGSHGAGGAEEFFFGSNAQKIVKHVDCPVLVVKQAIRASSIRQIVFASDFREEAKHALEQLMEFAAPLQAHLHLVPLAATEDPTIRQAALDEFRRMCWRLPCTVHHLAPADIETRIAELSQTCHADLVAVAHYGHPAFNRIFTGSLTEALVNHLDIPVLTLNNPETRPHSSRQSSRKMGN